LVPEHKRTQSELWLANGSRCVALPGDPTTTRGFNPALVVLDEASRIDEGILAAVLPMLTESKGQLLVMSTPAGRRGFFFQAWSDESQDWERISAKRSDYPHRLDPEDMKRQRANLGPALFKQEHENEFIEDGDQLIGDDSIKAMRRYNRPGLVLLAALEDL
jgi:hypothetical protein